MKQLTLQQRTTVFVAYVGLLLVGYGLFGTNLIDHNIKEYLYTHLASWQNGLISIIPIAILAYLWPRKAHQA